MKIPPITIEDGESISVCRPDGETVAVHADGFIESSYDGRIHVSTIRLAEDVQER